MRRVISAGTLQRPATAVARIQVALGDKRENGPRTPPVGERKGARQSRIGVLGAGLGETSDLAVEA